MPDSINLRTDREPGDYVEARDVNQISQAVNHLAANIGGGGTTDHRDLTNRDALNQHPINAITNLSATLANKSNLDHNHSISGVVGLQAELDNKAEVTHNHNIGDVSNLWETLGGKAEVGHTHDDRYYTESEVDAALAGKANTSHSHPVTDLTATGTPSATTYLRGDGAWATPEGGGGSQGPSHASILASGDVTLPVEHPVLTIRADDPATLSLLEAPDGTVVTIHVAHGWENLTWGPGITVTGDSATTETWVVLVRAEGAWSALVSGSGGGGMTGHGRPDGKSWPHGGERNIRGAPVIAPLGTIYTDLDRTDGALQWVVLGLGYIWWDDPDTGTRVEMEAGPVWTVTVGQTEWSAGSQSWRENQLTPPAGYDNFAITATRKGDWVDVRISLVPSGIGQGVPVTVPAVQVYPFGAPQNFAPGQPDDLSIAVEGHPDFVAAVGEPPQVSLSGLDYMNIPSFEVGAFTAGQYSTAEMVVKAEYRIRDFFLPWPLQMVPEHGWEGGW